MIRHGRMPNGQPYILRSDLAGLADLGIVNPPFSTPIEVPPVPSDVAANIPPLLPGKDIIRILSGQSPEKPFDYKWLLIGAAALVGLMVVTSRRR